MTNNQILIKLVNSEVKIIEADSKKDKQRLSALIVSGIDSGKCFYLNKITYNPKNIMYFCDKLSEMKK